MKVLHLISSEGFYGAENMLIVLARHEEAEGCAVTVGVFHDGGRAVPEVARRAQALSLRTQVIPCDGRFSWITLKEIRQRIAAGAIDVLHTHGYKTNFYALLAALPRRRVALLSTVHGRNRDTARMSLYTALDTMVLRSFDRVVAVSDAVARALVRAGVRPELVSTIPNGVDCGSRVAASFRTGRPVLGMVARLIPGKGGDVLLRSAKEVLAREPRARFYFFGDGPSRLEWEALARELGIAGSVVFAGIQSDIAAVYASIDALVLPSLAEGLPMCVLEAFAAGVPVVASAVGSIPMLVVPGRTGLLVPPGDSRALADAILEVLADPERSRVWGGNGRALVQSEYSAGLMARRYMESYRAALLASTPTFKRGVSTTAA